MAISYPRKTIAKSRSQIKKLEDEEEAAGWRAKRCKG